MDLEDCPLFLFNFGTRDIMNYCDMVNECITPDVPINLWNVNKKANTMFEERFVFNIKVTDTNDIYVISAKVKAEMKKKVVYEVETKIKKTNEVLSAKCQCAGGIEPSVCKHCLALLYAVASYSMKELFAAPTESLQRWHQVKRCKTEPRNYSNPMTMPSGTIKLNYKVLENLPQNNPFFEVLTSPAFDKDDIAYKNSIPLPAVVFGGRACSTPSHLTMEEILYYHKNIDKNIDEAVVLEKETMKQGNCPLWKEERSHRITASNFYKVCRRSKDFDSLSKQIYGDNFKDLSHIPAIYHGQRMEPKVKKILTHKFHKYCLRNTGLVINPLFPYLGASPDGLLYIPGDPILVEIKSAYNMKGLSLLELSKSRSDFCLEYDENTEKFSLKNNHAYMYQIQGQLGVCNLSYCIFVLSFKESEPVFTELIKFNVNLWNEMLIKLKEYYFKSYLPFLISKQN